MVVMQQAQFQLCQSKASDFFNIFFLHVRSFRGWSYLRLIINVLLLFIYRLLSTSLCGLYSHNIVTHMFVTSIVAFIPIPTPLFVSFMVTTYVAVWMLLTEYNESISHNYTADIKKCPDSIVGKQQRPQALLIYSYMSPAQP